MPNGIITEITTSPINSNDSPGVFDIHDKRIPEITAVTDRNKVLTVQYDDTLAWQEELSVETPWTSPEEFGAVGDGVTDDSEAWQNAINSGKNVIAACNAIYYLANALVVSVDETNNVTIDCNGSRFILGYTGTGTGDYSELKNTNTVFYCTGKTELWENDSYYLSGLDYDAGSIGYTLPDSNTYTGMVKIYGDNLVPGSDSSPYKYCGVVGTFDNGILTESYPFDITSPQIYKITPITVTIKNIGGIIHTVLPTSVGASSPRSVVIRYGLNCTVSNVNVDCSTSYILILFKECLHCSVINSVIQLNNSTNSNSYIFVPVCSSYIKVNNCHMFNANWHCVSSGEASNVLIDNDTPSLGYLTKCIYSYKINIDNCRLTTGKLFAYLDHMNARCTSIINSTLTSAYLGPGGVVSNCTILPPASSLSVMDSSIDFSLSTDPYSGTYSVDNVLFIGKLTTAVDQYRGITFRGQGSSSTVDMYLLNAIINNVYYSNSDVKEFSIRFYNTNLTYLTKGKIVIRSTNFKIENGMPGYEESISATALLTSHAEGDTTASGEYSHSEGQGTLASGGFSHAEGAYTTSSGTWSHAEGRLTVASGSSTHAEGQNTAASGSYSHAEGSGTAASGDSSHAEGHGSVSGGDYSSSSGYFTMAVGSASHVEGNRTLAVGTASHAEGYAGYYLYKVTNIDTENNTVTVSQVTTTSYSGNYSGVLGDRVIIKESSDSSSTSHNYYVTAITNNGQVPFVATLNTSINTSLSPSSTNPINLNMYRGVSFGAYSHSEGNGTSALSNSAHAEGRATIASSNYSHAEGYSSKASGTAAHAEGYTTVASGNYSHAEGLGTIASDNNGHALGKYNISGNYAHIVGNGSDDANRANIHTLDWDGKAWYAGKVSAGTVLNPANPTADNDLATKLYVDNNGSTYFGICNSASDTVNKVVTCSNFVLKNGAAINIYFNSPNTADQPTLNVNNTGSIDLYNFTGGGSPQRATMWQRGSIKLCVYYNLVWYMISSTVASTLATGVVKLLTTIDTSETVAATPKAVKSAYDLASSKVSATVFTGITLSSGPSNWLLNNESGYYEQTVSNITGLKSSYTIPPAADCVLSGSSFLSDKNILSAFGAVVIIETGLNSVTAKSVSVPMTDIPISITVFE